MSFLKGVFGGRSTPNTISGAETIERLCDRVQSSTLLDDRRDAVRAIRSLSKKYKLEVGTQAMQILIEILEKDRNDPEICGYALDALHNIMTIDPANEEEQKDLPSDITIQFSEVYIKNTENITLLVQLLDEFDFHIRWPTVKFLNVLIKNCTKKMQECILVSPMAISKLMDLLLDTREIIRNDTLILLQNLTKAHSNIQKIVAFENGFERLLEIIDNEGSNDGGIIVEDCLNLIINLLKSNSSNQNFFKEGNFIKRLCKSFELSNENDDQQQQLNSSQSLWQEQKCRNLNLLLNVVRSLVSPTNQQQIIQNCQKAINSCGLLHRLCAALMIPGIPAEVLTETLNTVAEIIRGNIQNQQFFASVMAPSSPPRQLLIILLMSMINEKQPFNLRCAILYCLQSYLYRNEQGQAQLIETLLPQQTTSTEQQQQQITSGQLLVGGLFNTDTISNWLCSNVLSYAILDNKTQKEQLLRVQLALNQQQQQSISLMQQCVLLLQEYTQNLSNQSYQKYQTIIALLMFLSIWMVDNRACVNHFLSQTNNVPYLISQISSNDTDEKFLIIQGLCAFILGLCVEFNSDQVTSYTLSKLKDTIQKRIGIEQFEDKLEYISQSEAYTKALQKQIFSCSSPSQLLYDYEFTRIFKLNETSIIKVLLNKSDENSNHKAFEENNEVIMQFKQIIREQDMQLNLVRQQFNEQAQLNQQLTTTLKQLEEKYQFLKDQHSLLKATTGGTGLPTETDNLNDEVNSLRLEIDNLRIQNSYYINEIQNYQQHQHNTNYLVSSNYEQEIENLKNVILNERTFANELKTQLDLKNAEISHLRSQITQLQNNPNEAKLISNVSESIALEARVKELKNQVDNLNEKCAEQLDTISKLKRDKGLAEELLLNAQSSLQLNKHEPELRSLRAENEALNKTIHDLNEEQENLLCLLQEMEDKCKKYIKSLKDNGFKHLIESEDDDEDDNDDNEDDGSQENGFNKDETSQRDENISLNELNNLIGVTSITQ